MKDRFKIRQCIINSQHQISPCILTKTNALLSALTYSQIKVRQSDVRGSMMKQMSSNIIVLSLLMNLRTCLDVLVEPFQPKKNSVICSQLAILHLEPKSLVQCILEKIYGSQSVALMGRMISCTSVTKLRNQAPYTVINMDTSIGRILRRPALLLYTRKPQLIPSKTLQSFATNCQEIFGQRQMSSCMQTKPHGMMLRWRSRPGGRKRRMKCPGGDESSTFKEPRKAARRFKYQ